MDYGAIAVGAIAGATGDGVGVGGVSHAGLVAVFALPVSATLTRSLPVQAGASAGEKYASPSEKTSFP